MDEPKPLDSLFKEKLFRIPDYQRGYAWGREQLDAFWDDLINLPVGPVGVSTTEVAFNQDVKAIIPKQELVGRYLAYWLSSNSHQLLKLATTATHGTKRFDMDELQGVSIGVPTLDEQGLIVGVLDEQQSIIERLQGLTAKFQAEKRGLMQDLLSGKRRVTALFEQREGVAA